MRTFLILSSALLLLSPLGQLQAQDPAEERIESSAREILSDPRLQDLMRSAKNDPEALAEEVQNDPEEAVRRATQIFQENQKKVDTNRINSPENREKAKALSTTALNRASELAKQEAEKEKETPAAEAEKKVPATRSTATTSEVATPVAMPVEGGDNPISTNTNPTPVVQNTEIEPLSNAGPTEAQIPSSPHLTSGEVPKPRPLSPKYDLKKDTAAGASSSGASGGDYMEIIARETIMDSKNGVLTFLGNVFVDHPDYDLKCEKLEIRLTEAVGTPSSGNSSAPAIKRAIATGGMVEIKRVGEDGAIQVALARKADYDAISQEFVLSGGPPYIQDGKRFVKTSSQDSRIIMRGNGTYEILGSDAGSKSRNTIRIPVPKNNSSDVGIGAGLGSGIEQLR